MSDELTVKYLGDSLCEIDGKTVNLDEIATNIVGGQDGDTIDHLIREHSDKTCEYHGEGVWDVDGEKMDEDEVIGLMAEILYGLDEPLLTEMVESYFTPLN